MGGPAPAVCLVQPAGYQGRAREHVGRIAVEADVPVRVHIERAVQVAAREQVFIAVHIEVPHSDDGRQKTKKEIMEEIIKKSKTYKAERRKDKEETDQLVDELNEDFKEIQGLLKSRSDPLAQNEEEVVLEKDDDAVEYNKLKSILGMDLRARATDRLKTEEEVAREERERLDTLEAARVKRMTGDSAGAAATKKVRN